MKNQSDLPEKVALHPLDLISGLMVPAMQTYLVAAPPFALDPARAERQLEALLTQRFPRFCYRFRQRRRSMRDLRLAPEKARPLTILSLEQLQGHTAADLSAYLGDRHWHLLIATHPQLTLFVLLFDHFLCHGVMARGFLFEACDRLRENGQGIAPPRLDSGQRTLYRDVQHHFTRLFQQKGDWARYESLRVRTDRIKTLSKRLGLSFTETLTLWISRAIQEGASRPRALEITSFRMDPVAESGIPEIAFGNRSLEMVRYEMLPEAGAALIEKTAVDGQKKVDDFVRFYQRFPFKGALRGLIRFGVRRAQRASRQKDVDKLVLNNLGTSSYPFFRTLFFDPENDADRFGLVFVDGYEDELLLQFSPPSRYLQTFSWAAFLARLDKDPPAAAAEPGPGG